MLTAMRSCRYLRSAVFVLCLNQAGIDYVFAQEAQGSTAAATESSAPLDDTVQATTPSEPVRRQFSASLSDTARAAAEQISAKDPDSGLLQRAGARIRNIEIRVDDVFDPNNPKERSWPYRAANALHITSRDSTIRPQLLFKPGDVYDRRVLDETARNLRGRSYLNEATITPLAYHPEDNTVDVMVEVHDVWTLNVGASYGRTGGANHSGFQLEDSNLLGLGKDLNIEREYQVERNVWTVGYSDPNLFSSRWELNTKYSSATDGGTRSFRLDHPFFSLDTRWYAEFDGLSNRQTDRRYEASTEVDQYRTEHESYGAGVGWSTGLRNGWVQRVSTGYRSDRYHYAANEDLTLLPLPDDERFEYPWIKYSVLEDNYEVERNRDQVGRTEDVYYGRSLDFMIGDSLPLFGADRQAWIMQMTVRDAWHLSARQSLFFEFDVTGRYEAAQWQGTMASVLFRYDFRRSWKNLFTASMISDYGTNLDPSQTLYLGGDSSDASNANSTSTSTLRTSSSGGLRGYPLHYRSGTRRNLLTIEQRYYTDWQILRLLTVGGAAFLDVGQISGGDPTLPASRSGVLSDVGFGLRLGNVRSSTGEVFHIEVAFPLTPAPGVSKVQFLVVTKHSF